MRWKSSNQYSLELLINVLTFFDPSSWILESFIIKLVPEVKRIIDELLVDYVKCRTISTIIIRTSNCRNCVLLSLHKFYLYSLIPYVAAKS